MAKTIAQRITINNILAVLIVGPYSGMWLFIMWYGITTAVEAGTDPVISILATMESLITVITTMTIIVVLVVQYHFRTNPPRTE